MKTTKLEKLRACNDAIEWVKSQKNPEEAWQNCERGDWMLWIAKKLDVDDRKLTLAKATCVKQVEHLLTDQRSKDVLEGCFEYAKGKITREELNILATATAASYTAASYTAASYTVYASYAAYASSAAAAYVTYVASYVAYASSAAAAYASYASAAYVTYDAASARKESLKRSADICREILTEDVLEKY